MDLIVFNKIEIENSSTKKKIKKLALKQPISC